MRKLTFFIVFLFIGNSLVNGQTLFKKGNAQIFDFVISKSENEVIFPYDNSFKVVNLENNNLSREFSSGLDDFVSRVTITNNDSILFAGFRNGKIVAYDLVTDNEIYSLEGFSSTISAMAVSSDNNYLAAASIDGELIVYDLKSFGIISQKNEMGFINELIFTGEPSFLFSSGEKGLSVLNPYTLILQDDYHSLTESWLRGLAIDEEGKQLYFSRDGRGILKLKYNDSGILTPPIVFIKEKDWINNINLSSDSIKNVLYSNFKGDVKLKFNQGIYFLEKKGIIYRNKVINYGPIKTIVFCIKDKGLYIYDMSDMNFKSY